MPAAHVAGRQPLQEGFLNRLVLERDRYNHPIRTWLAAPSNTLTETAMSDGRGGGLQKVRRRLRPAALARSNGRMATIEENYAALSSPIARRRAGAVFSLGALEAGGIWAVPAIVDAMSGEDTNDPHLPLMERSIVCFGIMSLARIAGRAIWQGTSPDSPDIRLAIETLERLRYAADADSPRFSFSVPHFATYYLSELHRLAADGGA